MDEERRAEFDGLAMPLVEAMETQRAIRRVRPDPVDLGLVRRCIELALRAPTGSNGQNWEFVVVTDPARRERFAEQYRAAWPAARARVAHDPRMASVLDAIDWQVEHFAEVPVLVLACLADDHPPAAGDPPIRVSSFYGSIYPAVQNLLLAARGVGLGASLVTLPLWSLASVRHIVDLPESVTPVCLIPMGWPVGRYGPTTRRSVDEVLHLDRFGDPFPHPHPGPRPHPTPNFEV